MPVTSRVRVIQLLASATLLLGSAGCSQQSGDTTVNDRLLFSADDELKAWAPNGAVESIGKTGKDSVSEKNQRGGYAFELVPTGNPVRHVLQRRQISSQQVVTVESSARSRTVIKAEWLGSGNKMGIAYSADFNADDRYELYWIPNTANNVDDAIRITPELGLGSDVVNWWPVNETQILAVFKQARLTALKLFQLADNDIANVTLHQSQFPLDAGTLGNSEFWFLSQQKLYVLTSPSDKLSPTQLNSYDAVGWVQKFPSSSGIGFETPEGYRALTGTQSFAIDKPVLDGIQCGQQSWLVGWKNQQAVISRYVDDRLIESVESAALPRNLRCERQRSK